MRWNLQSWKVPLTNLGRSLQGAFLKGNALESNCLRFLHGCSRKKEGLAPKESALDGFAHVPVQNETALAQVLLYSSTRSPESTIAFPVKIVTIKAPTLNPKPQYINPNILSKVGEE